MEQDKTTPPDAAQPPLRRPLQTAAEPPRPEPAAGDALAGALPDWDLLPASPFVRRIK